MYTYAIWKKTGDNCTKSRGTEYTHGKSYFIWSVLDHVALQAGIIHVNCIAKRSVVFPITNSGSYQVNIHKYC